MCSVDGCSGGGRLKRGLCAKHYTRLRRYGDPLAQVRLRNATVEERFWFHVIRAGEDDCWGWEGAVVSKGYGSLWVEGAKTVGAHQMSWVIHHGEIPSDRMVLHHCDNPPCSNPRHLYLGDAFDNMRDKNRRGRNPQAVLTEDEVRWLRSTYTGRRGQQRELAEHLGVAHQIVQRVVSGEGYRWVV